MKKVIVSCTNDKNSEFYYFPNFISESEQSKLMTHLNTMVDFEPCANYRGSSSRFQKWYQKEGKYFCPKWKKEHKRWQSFENDEVLEKTQNNIIKKLEKIFKTKKITVNSCLINRYDNGNNYIHSHRDSIESFGEYPIIIGLSLGAERTINFNKVIFDPLNLKSMKKNKIDPMKFSFTLESGSIFVMAGSSQKYFSHEIPKCSSSDKRYSLTFRNYIL